MGPGMSDYDRWLTTEPEPDPYEEIRREVDGYLLCEKCSALWKKGDEDYPGDEAEYCPNRITKKDDRGHAYMEMCMGDLHVGKLVTMFIETEW